MSFPGFEEAAVIVTLVLGAANVLQWILARKARGLHLSDLDVCFTLAQKSTYKLRQADKAIEESDENRGRRWLKSGVGILEGIRVLAQRRASQLDGRSAEYVDQSGAKEDE